MIKFFRKIRHRLLAENKFSRYLLYAIGEIILVVIGILIALQINEESTRRKNTIIESEILIDLKTEFEFNLQELEKAIEISNSIVINSKGLLRACWDDRNLISEDSILYFLSKSIMFSEQIFKYDNSVQLELINTGKQSMIKNKDIRRFISSWNNQLELIKYQEKVVDDFRHNAIDIFLDIGNNSVLMYGNSISEIDDIQTRSNFSLLKSNQFENVLSIYAATSNHLAIKKYSEMIDQISDIIVVIDNTLKNDG